MLSYVNLDFQVWPTRDNAIEINALASLFGTFPFSFLPIRSGFG
jgi:hypothetical protein